MLCPVCNDKPLKGRQVTCSTKCRSARYRERKQQQRDTSQQGGGPSTSANARRSSHQRRRGRDTSKWEQLLSTSFDRIIEAIERLGQPSGMSAHEPLRLDLREQVTSQAPTQAVGYRVVLPGRSVGDEPKLTPKRSRTRDVPWYTLSPFEYPDDIRLRDSCWYRIVWVDAQGQRIRLRPGEPAPGLFHVVGPPQFRSRASASDHAATGDAIPQSSQDASLMPGAVLSAPAEKAVPPSATGAHTAPILAPSSARAPISEPFDEEIINDFVEELRRAAALDEERVKRAKDSGDNSEEPAGFVVVLPPPPTSPPPDSWTKLLASYPSITTDENLLLIEFVAHPELMIQIHYEERLAQAKEIGRPPPREPVTLLSHEERQHLHALFTGRDMRPHFWSLCKAIFAYVKKHGLDVLAYLPVPVPPLPAAQQTWLTKALASPPKRAYMHYVCACQDALLNDQAAPAEPSSPLSAKERNQIRRAMKHLRAVMLFKKAASAA